MLSFNLKSRGAARQALTMLKGRHLKRRKVKVRLTERKKGMKRGILTGDAAAFMRVQGSPAELNADQARG